MEYKKAGCLYLCLCLILAILPIQSLAAGRDMRDSGFPADTSCLCQHHPVHTGWCMYSVGEAGDDCVHAHNEGCWVQCIQCVHTHTADCFLDKETGSVRKTEPNDGKDGSSDAASDAENGPEPLYCTHQCSEESGCITIELNCPHEKGVHDESCGYGKAENAFSGSCSYICPICKEQAPSLKDGEWTHIIRGDRISDSLLDSSFGRFAAAPAAAARNSVNTRADVDYYIVARINGKIFREGDHIEAMVGDAFSYQFVWSPKAPVKENDRFSINVFKIPGLNLPARLSSSLVINSIKVGEWTQTYDKTSGEMLYEVTFNRYIQLFDWESVLASIQGSGTFQAEMKDGPIKVGDDEGTLNVEERPTKPVDPYPPSGVGWKPQAPPVFKNDV